MLLLSVYETFLYYCCLLLVCRYILNCNPKKFYLYSSFIAFIPLVLIAISGNNTLHNIAYIAFGICQFSFLKLIFKEAKCKQLVFTYIFMYAINTIVVSLLINLIPFHGLLLDLLVNTITATLFVVASLTKIHHKIRKLLELLSKQLLIVLSALLISTTIISVVLFRALEKISIWNNIPLFALAILQVATCFTISILLINTVSNNHLKNLTMTYEQQIEAQAKHYKELAAANYESRRFKHDFHNMRIAIEKLLADGKNEQALALIQQCSDTLETPAGAPSAFDTGNGIADALLTDKQLKARHYNAVIQFCGALPQDCLSPTDLCVILGNTLDNAIEACQKLSPEVKKVISVACQCNSGFAFLSICNPVAERVNIDHNHIATTKENKTLHGFGLYSLQSVVKKHEGNVEFLTTDDAFSVEIDLRLNPDKTTTLSPPLYP